MLSLKQRISSVFFPFFPLSKGLAIDVGFSLSIGGRPINIETSKNHSSISSSIQITSTNQSNITRGDKQKEPSDIKKDKINTQAISINPSKIIEKVM